MVFDQCFDESLVSICTCVHEWGHSLVKENRVKASYYLPGRCYNFLCYCQTSLSLIRNLIMYQHYRLKLMLLSILIHHLLKVINSCCCMQSCAVWHTKEATGSFSNCIALTLSHISYAPLQNIIYIPGPTKLTATPDSNRFLCWSLTTSIVDSLRLNSVYLYINSVDFIGSQHC